MTVWYFCSVLERTLCSGVTFDLMANNNENNVRLEN